MSYVLGFIEDVPGFPVTFERVSFGDGRTRL